MPITILIADDHDIIREGIKSVLKPHSQYQVCAEANDASDVLAKVEQFKPDVLLLDITMPKTSGLDIIGQIRHIHSGIKIIIITVHKMGAYLMKAMRLGVNGYLNKDSVAEELIPALGRVCSGGTYLSESVSEYLVERMREPKEESSGSQILNQREMDVLRLVAEGKTAREIAEALFLSRRTVENYKNNILKKLNLHKTSDLIKYALENKIVDS